MVCAKSIEHELVALYPALKRFAHHFVRTPDDAEELVQETIIKALSHSDQFSEGSLKSWTFTILRNTFMTKYKRAQREPVGTQTDVSTISVPIAASQPMTVYVLDVEEAIDRLSPTHRDALLLSLSGASYQEIADRLECDIGTVKSRIARARDALRNELGEERKEQTRAFS